MESRYNNTSRISRFDSLAPTVFEMFFKINYKQDMWGNSKSAMKGSPGIWSHSSFRKDKSDCFPQKELIQIIDELD